MKEKKFCEYCGSELEKDKNYCTKCGKLIKEVNVKKGPNFKEIFENKNTYYSAAVIIGIVSFIIGVILLIVYLCEPYYSTTTKFGADFYTYTYARIVGIENDVLDLNHTLYLIASIFFMIAGLIDVCVFRLKQLNEPKTKK